MDKERTPEEERIFVETMKDKVESIRSTYQSLYGESLTDERLLKEVDRKIEEHKDRTVQELTRFYVPNSVQDTQSLFVMKDLLTPKPVSLIKEWTKKETSKKKATQK